MNRTENLKIKALSQNGTMTFYDNLIHKELLNDPTESGHILQLDDFLKESKINRFCSYEDRIKRTNNESSLHLNDISMSQGTHSLITWKDLSLYKSAYDLVIYSMLLAEIKPDTIIEYGSGSGGSAVWMADMASLNKIDTKIISYDINKPNFIYEMIEFVEFDLNFISLDNSSWGKGKKLVIEDAHINVTEVLLQTDKMLKSGDYLIVEDTPMVKKQKSVADFIANAKNTYEVDQHYLDFFGKNVGCCFDSIFRVV